VSRHLAGETLVNITSSKESKLSIRIAMKAIRENLTCHRLRKKAATSLRLPVRGSRDIASLQFMLTLLDVTRICRALQPGTGAIEHAGKTPSGNIQVVCYRAGVASSDNFWDRYINGATAADINSNIRDAYCVLVENWERGDDIFLVGFSRGSFVARMTSTLVYDIGILNKKGMVRS